MKTTRKSDSQIMQILRQAGSGVPVSELCREHGMSSATFYKWRTKYGGMDASMITRLKELTTDVDDYIDFYNHRRFHETLNYKKPMDVYQKSIKLNRNKKKAS